MGIKVGVAVNVGEGVMVGVAVEVRVGTAVAGSVVGTGVSGTGVVVQPAVANSSISRHPIMASKLDFRSALVYFLRSTISSILQYFNDCTIAYLILLYQKHHYIF